MNITLTGFITVIFVAVAISAGGIFLVRKNISLDSLRSHHDVTDPVLAVLGTLFAILIGFMLANSMQRFEDARTNIQTEAGGVGDIFRLVDGLPPDVRDKTRADCMKYATQVVKIEWPAMQRGKMSDEAWTTFNELWTDCVRYQPQTQGQSNIHQLLVQAMSRTGECRRTRLAELHYSLPNTLWFIVIFGGLSTIAFTYFFAVQSLKLQIAMTSVITIIVCLNVYVLAGYDAPFTGDIALTSAAFDGALDSMHKAVALPSK